MIKHKLFKRNCFCCYKKLGSTNPQNDSFMFAPNNALVWKSEGNYGSTLFDPMDHTYIEIYICDECVWNRRKHAYHVDVDNKKVTIGIGTNTPPESVKNRVRVKK